MFSKANDLAYSSEYAYNTLFVKLCLYKSNLFIRVSALLTPSPSNGERLFCKLIDCIEVFYRPIPLSLSSQFKMFALYANCGRYSKPYF